MHRIIGGLLTIVAVSFALLVSASPAFAQQITGKIDTIGFDGAYRPGCWTPLAVRLSLAGATPGNFELRVYQHDLDGDQPYFSRPISLSGGGSEQTFWTCFIPEPIQGGLTAAGTTPQELASKLRVTVNDAGNGRELAQVPLAGATATSVDPIVANWSEKSRATRFVLFIGTSAAPALRDYDPKFLFGIKENLADVRLRPEQLPEAAVAYEGVDAIVWLEGDPSELERGGGQRLNAIRSFVRRGGHLVLCTPTQWQQLVGFGDLLPVSISGTEQNTLQSPLRDLADRVPFPARTRDNQSNGAPISNPWDRFTTPFTIATAQARPSAVVDLYADRIADAERDEDRTPWLVRMPYGMGCVSWVGQDLGSRELAERANWGWPAVWETVLGSAGTPAVHPPDNTKDRFRTDRRKDLGFTVLEGMNLTGRAAQLIGLTILFFIGYWLIAGPGAYFFLRYKGRATLNWFAFGVLAVGATALTLLLVRLVVRGDPDVRHVSLVRIDMADPTDPAMAVSRLGMYVPQDGALAVSLKDADLEQGPSVTGFPIHPALHAAKEGDRFLYAAPRTYRVNVPGGDGGESAEAAAASDRSSAVTRVPFRTTMKRLRAQMFGMRSDRISGNAALKSPAEGYIAGSIFNDTQRDLKNVYVAFRHQTPGGVPTDWMFYFATWKAGATVDLNVAFNPQGTKLAREILVGKNNDSARPNLDFPVRGWMADWRDYLGTRLTISNVNIDDVAVNDLGQGVPVSVPVLSFFNRIPTIENDLAGGARSVNRADLYRSGLREWDVSNALLAGRLVVVAQADNVPIPLPLEVDGDPVEDTSGTTIYQFVLPLAQIPSPPKQPATTQATTMPVP